MIKQIRTKDYWKCKKIKNVSQVSGLVEVRHGYMPVEWQEALIVLPCGIQVGPYAVGGVITPRSLVKHSDEQDEEEQMNEQQWLKKRESSLWRCMEENKK